MALKLVNLDFINHEVAACNRLQGQVLAACVSGQVEGVLQQNPRSQVEPNKGIVVTKVNCSQGAFVHVSDAELNTLECSCGDGPLEDVHPPDSLY